MAAATIPLAIVMILLFTPPIDFNSPSINFVYFMIILMLFDTAYTAFNLNYNAVFSEMYVTVEARSSVGKVRIIFVMVALIFAFLLPTLIIEDITNINGYPKTLGEYQLTGIIAAVIIVITPAAACRETAVCDDCTCYDFSERSFPVIEVKEIIFAEV